MVTFRKMLFLFFFFFLLNIVCQELHFDSALENIPLNVVFSCWSLNIRICYIFDMLFAIYCFLLKRMRIFMFHSPLTSCIQAAVNKYWISSSEGQTATNPELSQKEASKWPVNIKSAMHNNISYDVWQEVNNPN